MERNARQSSIEQHHDRASSNRLVQNNSPHILKQALCHNRAVIGFRLQAIRTIYKYLNNSFKWTLDAQFGEHTKMTVTLIQIKQSM